MLVVIVVAVVVVGVVVLFLWWWRQHVQAFALTLAIDALPLHIAIIGTCANCEFDVFDVVFLKSGSSCSRESDKCAPVAAKCKLV